MVNLSQEKVEICVFFFDSTPNVKFFCMVSSWANPHEPVVRSPPIEPPFASPVGSSAAAGFRIDPARLGETWPKEIRNKTGIRMTKNARNF